MGAAVVRYSAPGIRPGGRLTFFSRKESQQRKVWKNSFYVDIHDVNNRGEYRLARRAGSNRRHLASDLMAGQRRGKGGCWMAAGGGRFCTCLVACSLHQQPPESANRRRVLGLQIRLCLSPPGGRVSQQGRDRRRVYNHGIALKRFLCLLSFRQKKEGSPAGANTRRRISNDG